MWAARALKRSDELRMCRKVRAAFKEADLGKEFETLWLLRVRRSNENKLSHRCQAASFVANFNVEAVMCKFSKRAAVGCSDWLDDALWGNAR